MLTDWSDVILGVSVCSEECHSVLIRAPSVKAPTQPLLGQLLLKDGLITEGQLEEALRVQQGFEGYIPLGHVLVEQKVITRKQLNGLLDRHRKRPKLGAVLVAARVITTDQLDRAIAVQQTRRVRLGDALRRLGLATERQIKQAMCFQLNLPFIDLTAFRMDTPNDLAKWFTRTYAQRHGIVPIAKLGSTLTVAMDDPTDSEVIRTVEASTGLVVNVVAATQEGLQHALGEVYGPS